MVILEGLPHFVVPAKKLLIQSVTATDWHLHESAAWLSAVPLAAWRWDLLGGQTKKIVT